MVLRSRRHLRLDGVLKTAAGLMGSQSCIIVGSFAVNLISARALGSAGRGELGLYTQIAQLVSVFCILGVEQSYPVAALQRPSVNRACYELWLLVRWPALIAIAGSALAMAWAIQDGVGGVPLIVGFSLYVAINVALGMLNAVSAASGVSSRQVRAVLIWQALLVSAAGCMALAEVDVIWAWLLIFGATGFIPLAGALRRVDRSRGRRVAWSSGLRSVRRLGLRLMGATTLNLLLIRIERLMLPLLADLKTLGVYVVVTSVTELADLPLRYYLRARSPSLAIDLKTNRPAVRMLYVSGLLYSLAAGMVTGIVGALTIPLLFGEEYGVGLGVSVSLALASAMYSFSRVGATVCLCLRMPEISTAVDFLGLLLLAGTCVAFVPAFAIEGIAYARLLSFGMLASASTAVAFMALRIRHKKSAAEGRRAALAPAVSASSDAIDHAGTRR